MNWRIGYKQLILPFKLVFMAESVVDGLFASQWERFYMVESTITGRMQVRKSYEWQNQFSQM
jgi:hypothetical protein